VVFTAHNAKPRDDTGRSLTKDELTSFDAVVVHTVFGEEALQDHGLDHLWRIPLGAIDLYDDLPDPDPVPAQLGDGPVVAMVGLLRPYKGANVLLDAWPKVRAAVPDAELVVAGRPISVTLPDPAPDGAHLVARFVTDEEYGWILRRSNIVCLPYLAVDMSAVLVTAMSMGRPMVLTDAGGFGEFVGHGAELVPAGDADALADALIKLLQDPARQSELSKQAKAAADSTWNWDAIAQTYTARYGELLGGVKAGGA
jgi:glycosyltransferase involved in cell wall biosynthesis